MKEIIAYEMSFKGALEYQDDLSCVPFEEKYWKEYMQIYNECFYDMRKDLDVEPFNFYTDYSQMEDKTSDTYLWIQDGTIAGAVSCYGGEIDDLIVRKSLQRRGLGRRLLLWGMNRIKEQGYDEIILHVAEWNQGAVGLYSSVGFEIKKREKVR